LYIYLNYLQIHSTHTYTVQLATENFAIYRSEATKLYINYYSLQICSSHAPMHRTLLIVATRDKTLAIRHDTIIERQCQTSAIKPHKMMSHTCAVRSSLRCQ